QFLGGFHDLVGVIDHARREEDYQLGAIFRDGLRAEQRSDNRYPVQDRDATRSLRVGLLDDAADRDRVAILHRDLRADVLLRKRRRLNRRARGWRYWVADLLVDHHSHDAAGINPRQDA